MTVCAECIVNTARSFVGAKWRHQGRRPWAMDCIGLGILTITACGFGVKDRSDYGRTPWKDGLRAELVHLFGEPVPRDDMRPADIVLMQWDEDPEPAHLGIVTPGQNGLNIVHSYSMVGVVEHRIDAVWGARIKEVFRPCA